MIETSFVFRELSSKQPIIKLDFASSRFFCCLEHDDHEDVCSTCWLVLSIRKQSINKHFRARVLGSTPFEVGDVTALGKVRSQFKGSRSVFTMQPKLFQVSTGSRLCVLLYPTMLWRLASVPFGGRAGAYSTQRWGENVLFHWGQQGSEYADSKVRHSPGL